MDGQAKLHETQSGGFIQSQFPSPPPIESSGTSPLPQPRSHPIPAGSAKESAFVNHVEQKLLHISGCFEKRHQRDAGHSEGMASDTDAADGYTSFTELATDLNDLVNLIWVSGTPVLQIAFLWNIGLAINTWLPAFSFAPAASFSLLDKLDHAYASLLTGTNVSTEEALPGFESGKRVTVTEMIRLRGIVEGTRVKIVQTATENPVNDGEGMQSDYTTETESTAETIHALSTQRHHGTHEWDMDVARTYERTIVELGTLQQLV